MRKILLFFSAALFSAQVSAAPIATGVPPGSGGGGSVSSVFARTGAVTAQSGDYLIGQISGAGTAAAVNTGTSAHTLPFLDGNNNWSGVNAFGFNDFALKGSSSGSIFIDSLSSTASGTWSIQNGSDTFAGIGSIQTITGKSIDGSEINSGTIPAAQLPLGSSSAFGALKCGSGTTCSGGTITASGGGGSPGGSINDIQYNNGSGGFAANADLFWDTTGGTSIVHIDGFGAGGQSTLQWSNAGGTMGIGHDSQNNGSNDLFIYNYTTADAPLVIDNTNHWLINGQDQFDGSGMFGIGVLPAAAGDFNTFTFTASDPVISTLGYNFTGTGYTPDADGTTITRTLYEYSTHGGINVYDAAPSATSLTEYFNPFSFSTSENGGSGSIYIANGQAYSYQIYALYNGKSAPGIGTTFQDTINDGVTNFTVSLAWARPQDSGGPQPDSFVIVNESTGTYFQTADGTTSSAIDDGSWTTTPITFGSLSFNLTMDLAQGGANENYELVPNNPNGLNGSLSAFITATGPSQSFLDDGTPYGSATVTTPTSPYTTPSIHTYGDANIGGNINLINMLMGGTLEPNLYEYPGGGAFADTANLYTFGHAIGDYFGSAPGNNLTLTSNFGRQTWSAAGVPQGATGITSYTLGDLIYGSSSAAMTKLAGNTTAIKKYLTQLGNGSVSAAPVWNTIAAADLPIASNSSSGAVGAVHGDGLTLSIDSGGKISCVNATSSSIGCAKFGTGLTVGGGVNVFSNAVYFLTYQPGQLSAVSGVKTAYSRPNQAGIIDNIIGSAAVLTCGTNPTITLFDCGSSTTCASPTTMGTVTITGTGQAISGSLSSANFAAGDYLSWAVTAGTCTSIDFAVNAQAHSN